MQSQKIPKRFVFGSREDSILKKRFEMISRREEENADDTVQSTPLITPTPTPMNTPCSFQDSSQDPQDPDERQKDYSENEKPFQNSSNKLTSNMESQSQTKYSSIQLLEHWKAVAIDSQKEVQILKSQITKVEAQNKNLIDARSRTEMMTRDPTETILYGLLKQNWQQTQTIQQLEKDESIVNMDGEFDALLSPKQINACMEKMKLTLNSVMHKNGISLRLNSNTIKANSDLQSLLNLLFGAEANLELESNMKDLDPQLLLRGLALAAVRKWIFMTDFPEFKENRLSKAQLKVMSQKGNWKCARRLAIASYLSIIRDPSFSGQDLREQTQHLVMRFSRALAPLCKPPHDSEKSLSNIWVDSDGTIATLFRIALTFKAVTIAIKHRYEFVVYPPGTVAAKTIPAVENFAMRNPAGKDSICEAWKHASLYVYEAESNFQRNELEAAMVKTDNFILQDADVRDKKFCLNSVMTMTISKGFDESNWDVNEEVNSVASTGLGQDKASSKVVQEKIADPKIKDKASVAHRSESIVKNGLQSGVEASIDKRTGKHSDIASGQRSEMPIKLSRSCSVCLNMFNAGDFEEHMQIKPTWCQPPCSACGGRYYGKASIAKHKRHGKKETNTVPESGSSKREKAPGLDLLVEITRKEIDVAEAKAPQNPSETSPERSHRRSTRLIGQEDIATEVNDVIIGDSFIPHKTEQRPARPHPTKCENCGIAYKSRRNLTRHKNAGACRRCPDCENWVGSLKSSKKHQCSGSLNKSKNIDLEALHDDCTRQKFETLACEEKTVNKSNGTVENQTSTETPQMSSKSSENPKRNLEMSNHDHAKTPKSQICSQVGSPLSNETIKSLTPAAIPEGGPLKRPRPSESQDQKSPQIQDGDSIPENTEEMRPTKLRRLDAVQDVAAKQDCPGFSEQKQSTFNSNYMQPLNPFQSSDFEFEKWQTFTTHESNERGWGISPDAAGPKNNWNLDSDYIAFESQSDTYSGLLGSFQHSFDISQSFNGESPEFISVKGMYLNGSQHPVLPGELPVYGGYHAAENNKQTQGLIQNETLPLLSTQLNSTQLNAGSLDTIEYQVINKLKLHFCGLAEAPSTFTLAKPDRRGRILPQAIAHRGYKAANPENTMGAFRGAVEVGAHAIETDLHISKDGVVVISHDPSLKRCPSRTDAPSPRSLRIPRYTWPKRYIWILLDIKLDNDADQIMSLIASTIKEVKPTRPWNQRVLLGCWAAKYIPLCATYLPDFPIAHIGFSIGYARQFLSVPNINFNMLRQILVGPGGPKFLADTRAAKRSVFVWTVNEEQWMRWSIKKGVDGVVTDDPKKYLEVCEEYDSANPKSVAFGFKDWMLIIWFNLLAMLFSWLFRKPGNDNGQQQNLFWMAGENEIHSSKFGGEERDGKKGTDSDYMLGTGHFDFVPNGDMRAMKGGVRVYQDGTEEAKREKKGQGNVSLHAPTSSMDGFNAESFDDSHQSINETTCDTNTDSLRAQSLPIKVKPKKSGVFGSLKKLIIRPKSEQDTVATGEHKSSTQSNHDNQGANRLNTIADSSKESKKPEDHEEHSSFFVSEDGRRIDNATGYEIITLDEFCQLHFNGVGAGPGATEPVMSNATSAPIDIPRNRRSREVGAERIARGYIDELPSSPFAGEGGILSSIKSHHGRQDSTDSSAHARSDSNVSGRQSQDTHPNISGRMSMDTEFSQPDEELMEQILSTSSGGIVNITPHNVDNVLAVLKGSFGTSSSSLSIGTPPRHHALNHPGHSNGFEALPISVPRPARIRALESQGHSASLPDTQGLGERVAKSHWAQENLLGKSPSAPSPLQQTTNFDERRRPRDILKRNNTTVQSPVRGFSLHNSNTGDVLYSRHPLANEITRSHSLANAPKTQNRKRPILQAIQEPPKETVPGPRYSAIPASLPPSSHFVNGEQDRQSPRLWNRKGTPAAKPDSRTADRVNPSLDRSSVMTTLSQFIPSRNEKFAEEITTNDIAVNASTKVSRRQMGRPTSQSLPRENGIPKVPKIPEAYAKHTAVLPKIGRDANGRFSEEYIEHEPGFPSSSMDDEVYVEAQRKMQARKAQEYIPTDPYQNHTVGTWDAILRTSPPSLSPLSSIGDRNEPNSPVSPISLRGGKADEYKWSDIDDGFADTCLSSVPCSEESDFVPQDTYLSQSLRPRFPPPFSRAHGPPLQHPLELSVEVHGGRVDGLPREYCTFVDPTVPVTRPLRIRKVKVGWGEGG
ncbi:hypothetical protein EYC80_011117 [Monilinia laxa]|uniref:GP-PDE domain-containing protein n=1 Tax=Monilinia laxa TaxID=61186 RepID=A0A5N6JQI1_MONLA|nr:hypothetical protein EYC80_011117 [Monilinia laxa]